MRKSKVGIIGSGNIGTDLMYKIERSEHLEMSVMVGIDPASEGLKSAKDRGYHVIDNGIDGLLEKHELVDIVFDATTAKAHEDHSEVAHCTREKSNRLNTRSDWSFRGSTCKFR